MDRRAAAHAKRLAPLGTLIEDVVEPAVHLKGFPASSGYAYFETAFDDSFRPVALRLARKFIRPDEQILGAIRVRHDVSDPAISVIVFTHGFAVKGRGAAYRTDTRASFQIETPTNDFGARDKPPFVTACLVLGETTLSIPSNGSQLFDVLWLQESLRSKAKSSRKASRAKKVAAAPAARLIRTARDAELVAAEWMTHLATRTSPRHRLALTGEWT